MTCDTCGVEIRIGDFPFCPHGRGTTPIRPDDVPGGFIVENGFATPQRFDSHSAHEKALAAQGLEIKAMNRGPNDKICKPWDAIDLESAQTLVLRGVEARRERRFRWPNASIPITVTPVAGPGVKGRDL